MTEPNHAGQLAPQDFARSRNDDWSPPEVPYPESEVLRLLEDEWELHHRSQFALHERGKKLLIADLDYFEVYHPRNDRNRAYELTCLHFLGNSGGMKFHFDGIVRLGKVRHYVKNIPIQDACIGIDIGKDTESTRTTVYIQSDHIAKYRKYDIWYRLNRPNFLYKRFHDAFVWIGQLSKYVNCYMSQASRSLNCFRSDFHSYLTDCFGGDSNFESWHAAFEKKIDFRVAIVAYINYLFTQANNEPNSEILVSQQLWYKCMAKDVTPRFGNIRDEYTLATSVVYACFKDRNFGSKLSEVRPKREILAAQERRKRHLGFAETPVSLTYAELSKYCQPYGSSPIMVGDVVAIVPNQKHSKKLRHTKRDWLGYVQSTETLKNGIQRLFVLWLYWPHDTNIDKAVYPFENEVFFSDECNCAGGMLLSSEIKGKYAVDCCPSFANAKRFFIRQKYIATEKSSFVTFTDEHKICKCRRQTCPPANIEYRLGDTVYLKPSKGEDLLEPTIVQRIDKDTGSVFVRELRRLGRDCFEFTKKAQRSRIRENKLVLTNFCQKVDTCRLQHRCFIRFVSKADIMNHQIPFPYNRGGAGDFWFISMGLDFKSKNPKLVFLRKLPRAIRQRVKFESDSKLRGLSLFSGGGLLDRGLEEGCAVEFRTAIDSNINAVRTQQANVNNLEGMCLYCGSVNKFFDSALKGDEEYVARVGEVDFIAAGSPCVVFSLLQRNTKSEDSLRIASLISSFCSFVDFYRPLYAVLENVVEVSSEKRTDDLLSQVLACLVSMGYQANQFIMDSWSYGSPQHRSRLILTIAASGYHPIMQQPHTHSCPEKDSSSRKLGKLLSGQRYGTRKHYLTPLNHVRAATVSSGLPDIGNSLAQTCIPYPDHRVVSLPTATERSILERIPRNPPGCGYQEPITRGLIPDDCRSKRKKKLTKPSEG